MARTFASTLFVLLVLGLGVADVLLVEGPPPLTASIQQPEPNTNDPAPDPEAPPKDQGDPVIEDIPDAEQPTTGGVRKTTGVNVRDTALTQGFEYTNTKEELFLPQIIPSSETEVERIALLLKGDRAGSIAWADSNKVKLYYLALKEALHSNFTSSITDLVDETQRRTGLPPRNFLSFLDPGISEERIVFVRVRERILEIRMQSTYEKQMFELIDELSK